MVLRAMGLIRLPTRDKTTDYMRYTLRLKPFWGISSPEILPFEGYTSMFTIPKDTRIVFPLCDVVNLDGSCFTASVGKCWHCTASDWCITQNGYRTNTHAFLFLRIPRGWSSNRQNWPIGYQKLEEILYRDKHLHSRTGETSCRKYGRPCRKNSHHGTQISPPIRTSQTYRRQTTIKDSS